MNNNHTDSEPEGHLTPDQLSDQYFEGRTLSRIQGSNQRIFDTEFYNCIFDRCDFYNIMFSNCQFEKCRFENSDLSMARFSESHFVDVSLIDCKAIGVNWQQFKMPVRFSFTGCKLDNSIFTGVNLIEAQMIGCSAQDIDFSDANMSKAVLTGTDFLNSRFDNTNLSFADFKDAIQYDINPLKNKLKKTVFSHPEVLSLLHNFDIIIK